LARAASASRAFLAAIFARSASLASPPVISIETVLAGLFEGGFSLFFVGVFGTGGFLRGAIDDSTGGRPPPVSSAGAGSDGFDGFAGFDDQGGLAGDGSSVAFFEDTAGEEAGDDARFVRRVEDSEDSSPEESGVEDSPTTSATRSPPLAPERRAPRSGGAAAEASVASSPARATLVVFFARGFGLLGSTTPAPRVPAGDGGERARETPAARETSRAAVGRGRRAPAPGVAEAASPAARSTSGGFEATPELGRLSTAFSAMTPRMVDAARLPGIVERPAADAAPTREPPRSALPGRLAANDIRGRSAGIGRPRPTRRAGGRRDGGEWRRGRAGPQSQRGIRARETEGRRTRALMSRAPKRTGSLARALAVPSARAIVRWYRTT
jgi:hypothetical protein